MNIFLRKAYKKMLDWKNNHAPSYVLFLKGARRTGKTTLAVDFAKKEYKTYILIDFTKASSDIKDLFKSGLHNLDSFYSSLEYSYQTSLYRNESVIILDEIQFLPEARQALKVLLEDGRYHFIETGSVASIIKKSQQANILVPSEEEVVEINPLDFDEFLDAIGKEDIKKLVYENAFKLQPLPNIILKEINKYFRLYLVIGGMPQAVAAYINKRSFKEVDFIKRSIITLYKNDMKEQKNVNSAYVGNLFDNIASELSKHDKEFVLSHVDKNARIERYNSSLGWLEDSNIVNVCRLVSEPSLALSLTLDELKFKMYLLDTGLLVDLAFDDGEEMDDEFYEAIMKDRLHVNEGMIIENSVSQGLHAIGKKLRYNSKVSKEEKRTIREIDFLIKYKHKILPIEVKSSEDGFKLKSLDDFLKTYSSISTRGLVLYPGNIKKVDNIWYLPYFFSYYLNQIDLY